MTKIRSAVRCGIAILIIGVSSACSSSGGLGSILGGVLGGGGGGGGNRQNQVSGTIQRVDTRNQQLSIRQSNGQNVTASYDDRTRVSYQDQNYPVTSLESGDEVTVRIQSNGNQYYVDFVQVNRSVSTTGGGATGGSSNVQSLQGIVRRVDPSNGVFIIDASNNVQLTVSLPYNATRNDVSRFQNLRVGDNVRFYGIYLNNARVELRQFY